MDALLLRAVIREISAEAVGGRVTRVDQPGRYDVLLSVRKPGSACRILLSADPQLSRMYLTSSAFEMPRQAPAFCMLLRKRIEGGKIEVCEPLDIDRVCMLRIASRDELGNPANWTLVLEATGRNANILLLDPESTVQATIRRPARSAAGGDKPQGSVYVPPATTAKTAPGEVVPGTFAGVVGSPGGATDRSCRDEVLKAVAGFGGVLAQEACFRAGRRGDLAAAVREIWEECERAKTGFLYVDSGGTPVEAHVASLLSLGASAASFASPSAALDHYYRRTAGDVAYRAARQVLGQRLKALVARTQKRLAARLDELDEAKTGELHRKAGDLILTYMSQVAASLVSHEGNIALPDPETGEGVAVELDPSLDAPANAQVHYRKYARLKARVKLLSPLVGRDRDDLLYLESVLESLDEAKDLGDLTEIEKELREQGLVARDKGGRRAAGPPAAERRTARPVVGEPVASPSPARCARFVTSRGEEVLAGRNNRQNEYVTFKMSGRNDLWFHAKAVPGAHVLLKVEATPVAEESLVEAATVAATLSRARSATKVEVDFCKAQNVKKRPGSRPGMVLYDKYQTIVVRPDPALIARLSSEKPAKPRQTSEE